MLKHTFREVLTMLWLAEGLLAEEHGTVAVGSRVRVIWQETGEAAAHPLIGQVVALEPGVVVVLCKGGTGQRRLPIAPSATLEVSTGKKSQAARGAMVGAAVGAMPGLFMTFGDYNTDKGNPAAVSVVGAAAGAAIGSVVGLALHSENWLPADLPPVTAGIAPIRRGVSVSFSVVWGRGPQ
jgi:hypothetical protein